MKRILLVAFLAFTSVFSFTQTVVVSGNVKSIFGDTTVAAKSRVCASLVLSDGQRPSDPHVAGVGILTNTQNVCLTPVGDGSFSTAFFSNDSITVQGVTDTTFWNVSYLYNGVYAGGGLYHFLLADVTENLNSKSPATLSPSLTVTPTDNVYMRLDAGNSPTSAAWGFKGLGILAGFDFQFGGGPGIYMDHTLFALGFKSTGFLGWASGGFANAAFDTGESRCGVATVCFGNGTQGDVTGTVQAGALVLGGGTALTSTNQTGTGSVVLGTAPTITNSTQNIINQPAATAFILKDNQGGTRLSIPSGGVTQSTINNALITGGSTLASPTISGTVGSYNNITTAALGLPVIVGYDRQLAKTTNQGTTALFATGASTTLYTVMSATACTTTSAAATVQINLLYTDTSGTAQTVSGASANCTALGANSAASLQFSFMAKDGTNIQYSTTIANTPTYDVRIAILQIGIN